MTTINTLNPDYSDLKLAQLFYLDLARNANFTRSYKAPHAMRGTPEKPHYARGTVLSDEEGNPMKRVIKKRLFKGHRK